jgi:hypothetical protein
VANRDTTQYGVQYLNDGIYDDEAHRTQDFFTGLHDRTCNRRRRKRMADKSADSDVKQKESPVSLQSDMNPSKQQRSCLSDPSRNQITFRQTMSRIFRQESQLMTQHARVFNSLICNSSEIVHEEQQDEPNLFLTIQTNPIHINLSIPSNSSDIMDTSRDYEIKVLNQTEVIVIPI